jgi:hypothetical protein
LAGVVMSLTACVVPLPRVAVPAPEPARQHRVATAEQASSPSALARAAQGTYAYRARRGTAALDGPTVARHLQQRYDERVDGCQGSTHRVPAFLCSGVLMRSTAHDPDFYPWNPRPGVGGVSFSWLRQDANWRGVFDGHNSGFIFLPLFYANEQGYQPVEVLCAFPVDGWTWYRDANGCGKTVEYPSASRPCHVHGVATAEAWMALYRAAPDARGVCGFAVGIGEADALARFNLIAPLMRELVVAGGFDQWNELIVREWAQNLNARLPLEAFYYVGGTNGLATAMYDQASFVHVAKRWVPVIRVDFARMADGRATFTYSAADQGIGGP